MIEESLLKLGLNNYEVQAYLYLVRNRTMGAVALSKKCGVPFGRIYDILYDLGLKGFVKVIPGYPKKFAAEDPKIAIESILRRKKETLFDIGNQIKKDIKELEQIYKVVSEDKKPSVWVSHGKVNIRESRIREISEAQKEILALVSSDMSTGFDPHIERLAREAQKKGIKRLFLENPKTKEEWKKVKSKLQGGAKIKKHDYSGFTLSVVDQKFVRIEIKDKVYDRVSIIIENNELSKFLKDILMLKWKESKELT